jgi:hypothetical protein
MKTRNGVAHIFLREKTANEWRQQKIEFSFRAKNKNGSGCVFSI